MSRGEGDAGKEEGKGPGMAIAVSFVVLCLGVTFLVLLTTDACERWGEVPPPPQEPFGGAAAALAPLGWRDSQPEPVGLTVHAAPAGDPRQRVERILTATGYVEAEEDWAPPAPLPLRLRAVLEGQCGVVALAADGWATISEVAGADGDRYQPAGEPLAMVAACGDDEVRADGSGLVYVRSFAMPGLTPADVAAQELPLDVLLAHAEAEARLARLGWEASDQVVVVEVPAGAVAHVVDPPAEPARGCVPWVAVGLGLSGASVRWDHAVLDQDPTRGRFMLGAVSCAPDGSTPRLTPIEVSDHGTDGGTVTFRPYAATAGPVLPAQEPAVPAPGRLRVASGAISLPEPVAAAEP